MLGIGIGVGKNGNGEFDSDAQAIINNMSVTPNSARQIIINDMVVQLKNDGNWDKLDTLWVMAAHTDQAGGLNWKIPTGTPLTEINTPTFIIDEGFLSDGSMSYLETNFDPSIDGVNYTQNDCSMGLYCRTNLDENSSDMGMLVTGPKYRNYIQLRNGGITYVLMNQGGFEGEVNSSTLGTISGERTGANAVETFRNGISLGTHTQVSSALRTGEHFILARFNDGGVVNFSNRQLSIAFHGSTLNHLTLHNALNDYMTSLGKNVV